MSLAGDGERDVGAQEGGGGAGEAQGAGAAQDDGGEKKEEGVMGGVGSVGSGVALGCAGASVLASPVVCCGMHGAALWERERERDREGVERVWLRLPVELLCWCALVCSGAV